MSGIPLDLTPEIIAGHVLDVLAALPEESVHTVVTSPPYWALRAYGTTPQVWGGDPAHAHEWAATPTRRDRAKDDAGGEIQRAHEGASYNAQGGEACACGAWRGELGLEATPELYVEHVGLVFDAVHRVLRSDGTLWLNLGDTYATHPAGLKGEARWKASTLYSVRDHTGAEQAGSFDKRAPGLKPKDLVGIPWRVALDLQRRGWWLRSDCIWAKPNPMPESVTDRPTRSHEYVFLLTKSARYFYDAEAVRGPLAPSTIERARSHLSNPTDNPDTESKWGKDEWRAYPVLGRSFAPGKNERSGDRQKAGFNARWAGRGAAQSTIREVLEGYDGTARKDYESANAQDPSATKARIIEGMRKRGFTNGICDGCGRPEAQHVVSAKSAMTKFGENAERVGVAIPCNSGGANLKTVWQIATQPYPEAHFATFPETIPDVCIRAGTSARGVCAKCGAPWVREVEAEGGTIGSDYRPDKSLASRGVLDPATGDGTYQRTTLGFVPTCECGAGTVPCLVLDPFAGSGTVLAVARRLGRRSVGVELKPEYLRLARRRSGADRPDLESYGRGSPGDDTSPLSETDENADVDGSSSLP